MIDIIKQVVKGMINDASLSDVEIGEVTSTQPIAVKLVNNKIITEHGIIQTQMVINYPLENGDKVLLIKKAGLGTYFIIDKV